MPQLISETGSASPPPSHTPPDDSIPVVPLRHPVRRVVAILLLLFAAVAAWNVATNHRFGWDVVASYLFAPEILRGALLTVVLTVISMIAGVALGTVLAVMRISDNPIVSRVSQGFIWFFRGTPLLVQLIFWYNIAALYPRHIGTVGRRPAEFRTHIPVIPLKLYDQNGQFAVASSFRIFRQEKRNRS